MPNLIIVSAGYDAALGDEKVSFDCLQAHFVLCSTNLPQISRLSARTIIFALQHGFNVSIVYIL